MYLFILNSEEIARSKSVDAKVEKEEVKIGYNSCGKIE